VKFDLTLARPRVFEGPFATSLSWLNTVFDTCVSFTIFSQTLDPLVAKNSSRQVSNTNFGFLIVKLTHGNMTTYKKAFKIGFVYLQKISSLDSIYNLPATSL